MVLKSFIYFGNEVLVVMKDWQDLKKYENFLKQYLLDWAAVWHGKNRSFQQHNCSTYVSKHSEQQAYTHKANLLDWPSRVADPNLIENMCAVLPYRAYYNAHQFASVDDLRKVIYKNMDQQQDEVLQAHLNSVQRRCIFILTVKGASLKYWRLAMSSITY